jgi:hypothetical protein
MRFVGALLAVGVFGFGLYQSTYYGGALGALVWVVATACGVACLVYGPRN